MHRALVCLALAWSLAAAPLFESNFEKESDWKTVRGIAFPDPSVSYKGRRALSVQPLNVSDAYIASREVKLAVGASYELSGYVRTEDLEVTDAGRSPVATGASLGMASMPFDVHSEALGRTQTWKRLHVRFVASREQDRIVLKIAEGGSFRGKAWFAGITIQPAEGEAEWPVPAAVRVYGPAYAYPYGGWTYLHVEGEPYERGYQHGRLLSDEIPKYLERCAADYDPKSKDWNAARNTAAALFLHGFDQEILQEMRGIADGASDGGGRWQERRIDLLDIVTANTIVEMETLRAALPMTPSGLEGLHLSPPHYSSRVSNERCSAFAATGKATPDGKMVMGHTTWWPLTLAELTNVLLDISPAHGHRMLMQSYPGGIESGTDWYQNDAGIVLTETTLRQGPFNPAGVPVAYRARRAIQDSSNIDQVVAALSNRNNGLYTNEWLIGDAKTNEIAMFELGTHATRLWRSSKNEWFGGTEGFYWGCNNAKDLKVRLEYQPNPHGPPEHVPYVPGARDLAWQRLYKQHQGNIDEQFAFLAFRTAPLVSRTSMDAKVVTADMALNLMLWADFGKPNQREWTPSTLEKQEYAGNEGLYTSGYRLVTTQKPRAVQLAQERPAQSQSVARETPHESYEGKLWSGWILPASEEDVWLSAGVAAYYDDLSSGDVEHAVRVHWTEYRAAGLAVSLNPTGIYERERHHGALLLDSLRRGMGDERFLDFMRRFFEMHAAKPVSSEEFLHAAGTTPAMPLDPGGPLYIEEDLLTRLPSALIVYGTTTDAGANRYAAEELRARLLEQYEQAVPVRKDFEVTDEELSARDVVFVGRPESNSALAGFRARLDLNYSAAAFQVAGEEHAWSTGALMLATANPMDARHMFLILAGNSALETVRLAHAPIEDVEYSIFESGELYRSGFLPAASPPKAEARFSQR